MRQWGFDGLMPSMPGTDLALSGVRRVPGGGGRTVSTPCVEHLIVHLPGGGGRVVTGPGTATPAVELPGGGGRAVEMPGGGG